jgi:hypothetical protein
VECLGVAAKTCQSRQSHAERQRAAQQLVPHLRISFGGESSLCVVLAVSRSIGRRILASQQRSLYKLQIAADVIATTLREMDRQKNAIDFAMNNQMQILEKMRIIRALALVRETHCKVVLVDTRKRTDARPVTRNL